MEIGKNIIKTGIKAIVSDVTIKKKKKNKAVFTVGNKKHQIVLVIFHNFRKCSEILRNFHDKEYIFGEILKEFFMTLEQTVTAHP